MFTCNLPKMRICDIFENGFQKVYQQISYNGISSHDGFFHSVLLQFIVLFTCNANNRSDIKYPIMTFLHITDFFILYCCNLLFIYLQCQFQVGYQIPYNDISSHTGFFILLLHNSLFYLLAMPITGRISNTI